VARFQERLLAVAESCYRFVGGERQVSSFDLGTPIQPVHDYARQSELGARGVAGEQGYLRFGQSIANATAGAATLFASTDPYATFAPDVFDFDPERHTMWLVDCYAAIDSVTPANWSNGMAGLIYDPSGTNRLRGLERWDGDLGPLVASGNRPAVVDETNPFPPWRPNVFLPRGTLLVSQAVSTDDCIQRVHYTLWAGPVGTTPPGMM